MTHFSAKWKVLDNPQSSQAFYSPWIGAGDPAHKLLIQPVNPWTGDGWQTYNEIYSWYTGDNFNSNSAAANAGDVLQGSMDYTPHNGDSVYTIKNTNTASGWSVTTPHAMPSYVRAVRWPGELALHWRDRPTLFMHAPLCPPPSAALPGS